eukprot:6485282-Lingulodinium_polyedra.AAC.1
MPSRVRRFCSVFGVRATGGQTAIKWKRARACGHRLYEKDASLLSTICRVTKKENLESILKYGLMPGVMSG